MENNDRGTPVTYIGHRGAEEVTIELTKLKLGYDLGSWFSRLTIAYEDRERKTDPVTYLTNTATGLPDFAGSSGFGLRAQDRETLLLGFSLDGPIPNTRWSIDSDFSYFDVLQDEEDRTSINPGDISFDAAAEDSGRFSEFDDTGWITYDIKARNDEFLGNQNMNMVTGYHYNKYELEFEDIDTRLSTGENTGLNSRSGGETQMHAVFAQWGWQFMPTWDVALGGRYEYWQAEDGFFVNSSNVRSDVEDRSKKRFSPKFSLGFNPAGPIDFRYSAARAFRFPIVQELFETKRRADAASIADPSLQPEDGIHHNFTINYELAGGFVRANLFHEQIDDVIFNQTALVDGATISTFLPVTEVTTTGIELIYNQQRILGSNADVRFNVNYVDSEVTESDLNPDIEGNDFPRMPEWRANLFLTYHLSDYWNASGGIRYASDSFGRLDNEDREDEVFGGHDQYVFVDLKTRYQVNEQITVAAGVDNLFNEEAFVFHPWPQRTIYGELKFSIE